jgi:hypothetical protein
MIEMEEVLELHKLCKNFIKEHHIVDLEQVYDSYEVQVELPHFLEKICDLIGYLRER